MHVDYIPTLT